MNAPDFSSGFASTAAATNHTEAAAIGDGRTADYGGANGHSEPQAPVMNGHSAHGPVGAKDLMTEGKVPPSQQNGKHDAVRFDAVIMPDNISDSKLGPGAAIDLSRPLSLEERQRIVTEAMGTDLEDAEDLLRRQRARLDAVGMEQPSVELRFQNLHIETSLYSESGRNLPTIFNAYRNAFEYAFIKARLLRPEKRKMAILNDVSSVIRPGRTTLLLGPPAAGKSTLLKALAGKLGHEGGLKISGDVTYNGRTFAEFIPERTSVYVEQEDKHMPELSVRETFNFAALCHGTGGRRAELAELRRREHEAGIVPEPALDRFMDAMSQQAVNESVVTEYIIRMLGLEVCADTKVGNQMIRGISGGQKKRVTSGEMLVSAKRVLLLDEISTGLDSSTTYQIVKFLADTTHYQNYTTLIALLQPAPETYDLFDDILLLSDGYVVYHGPREHVVEFFEQQGFVCPERKGVADFLQEVTSRKDQKQYWSNSLEPHKYVTVAEFSERFKKFHVGRAIIDHLATPPPLSEVATKGHSGQDEVLVDKHHRYALSPTQLFWACWSRENVLVSRNLFQYGFRFFVTMFMAVVTATLFLRTNLHPNSVGDGQVYFGVIFFSLIMVLFDGFAEETLTVQRLPGWFKQRDNYFYPAWAYVYPTTVLRMPYSMLVAVLWSCIVYYPVGLAPEASRFFTFMLLLFLLHSMGLGMFRLIASLCRDETISSTGGAFFFLTLLLLGGFLLPRNDIHPWWIWFYWINPLSYAQQAIAINEYRAPRWAAVKDSSGQPAYKTLLQSHGSHTDQWWIWLGVVWVIIGWAVFNIMTWFNHSFLNPLDETSATLRPSEEEAEEEMDYQNGKPGLEPVSEQHIDAEAGNGKISKRSIELGRLSAGSGTPPGSRRKVSPGNSRRNVTASSQGVNLTTLLASRKSLEQPETPSGNPVSRRSVVSSGSGGDVDPQAATGMVLPFDPLALSFHDLCYYVPIPSGMADDPAALARIGECDGQKQLQLLRNCSGAFRPGILTALVGSSGAGKTTLMDCLAGRKTTGTIKGDVRVSGHPKVQETFARIMGYVEQYDIHSPNITVYESLVFSARLRHSRETEQDIIFAFVREVMELVELVPLANSIVGKPGISGLSVEQRKRLTIAVELVANPSIVFMDEPTSGLDARAAAIVMRTVRNTVNTGRTVVCTIHQPSIDIFESFDDLLLMKYGGSVIYHGHLGKRSHRLIEYFRAVPGVPDLQEGLNPATWMLQVSTPGMETTLGVDYAEIYRQSDLFRRNEELIEKLSVPPEGQEPLHFNTKFPQNYGTQFRMIFWKFWMSYWRNPQYNATRFLFAGVLAFIIGTILWKVGHRKRNSQDLGNILGALYLAMLFLGIINSRTVQPPTSYERSVMYRERAAGMYDELPFAVAQCLVELPYNLLQAFLFALISYWMLGFENNAGKFFWFGFIIFLTLNLMCFYGVMGVYITPDLIVGTVLSAFFYGFWNLFAGFIVAEPRMVPWWKWYYYVNPIAWTLYGIIVTQLGQDTTTITVVGQSNTPTIQEYLQQNFNYRYSFIGPVVGILLGFTVFFGGLAIGGLKFMRFQKR